MSVTKGYVRGLMALLRTDREGYNRSRYKASDTEGYYAQKPELKAVERRIVERYLVGRRRILEVGCGAGRVSAVLRSEYRLCVRSLDIAENLIRSGVRLGYLPAGGSVVGDAACLPFAPESFDSVWFTYNGVDLLYPREQRRAFLREAWRVLAGDGLLVFSSHTRPRLLRSRTWLEALVFAVNVMRPRFWRDGYFLLPSLAEGALLTRCEDIGEVLEQAESAGFRKIAIESRYAAIGPDAPPRELRAASRADRTPTYVFMKP
jgi:SAM-dependent methyltransferase